MLGKCQVPNSEHKFPSILSSVGVKTFSFLFPVQKMIYSLFFRNKTIKEFQTTVCLFFFTNKNSKPKQEQKKNLINNYSFFFKLGLDSKATNKKTINVISRSYQLL